MLYAGKLLRKRWIISTYEKYLSMVYLNDFLYNKFIVNHLCFILLHNITVLLAHVHCNYLYFLGNHIYFSACTQTLKSLLVASIFSFSQLSEYMTPRSQGIFQYERVTHAQMF